MGRPRKKNSAKVEEDAEINGTPDNEMNETSDLENEELLEDADEETKEIDFDGFHHSEDLEDIYDMDAEFN